MGGMTRAVNGPWPDPVFKISQVGLGPVRSRGDQSLMGRRVGSGRVGAPGDTDAC